MSPFIETFTGESFHPLNPTQGSIWIEDIAHHLSNQCRFSGATRVHYSVAEHSVRVSLLLKEWGEDEDVQFWGLMHDASEAYLVDLPTPLKQNSAIGEIYRVAEKRLMREICTRFSMNEVQPARVTLADAVLLATEVRDLMPGEPAHWEKLMVRPHGSVIVPWSQKDAEAVFLSRFHLLDGGR